MWKLVVALGMSSSMVATAAFGLAPPGTAFAGPDERGHVDCGAVITQSTTLRSDVGPCAGDGVVVGADNVTLNLGGHRVFGTDGPGDGTAAGVRLADRSGVRVLNGTISDFDAGVLLDGGSGNTLTNLTVRDNVGPEDYENALLGDGIILFHSADNRILNNVVVRNGIFDGIGVLGVDSHANTIRGNRVEENVGTTQAPGAGTGIIVSNFFGFDHPRRGEAIRDNDIISNTVRKNYNSGISTISNVGGLIARNVVEDNGQGERCQLGRCSPVRPSNGIGVQAGEGSTQTTEVTVEQNRVSRNRGNAIDVSSDENRVTRNHARGNRGSGIFVRNGGERNEITDNVTRGNATGSSRRRRGASYDLHDGNTRTECGRWDDEGNCTAWMLVPTCDDNVWQRNAFDTAFPECAEGGDGAHGSSGGHSQEPGASAPREQESAGDEPPALRRGP